VVRLSALAVLLPAALVLSACGSAPSAAEPTEPRRGGTLTVLLAEPGAVTRAPDPHRVTSPGAAAVHGALFRTLYAWRPGRGDEEPELVADLAEALPEVSEDGRTLTVRLRADVRFAAGRGGSAEEAGRAVTAEDAERGLERALGDPVAGPAARQALGAVAGLPAAPDGPRDVRGVEALDERTLVLRLTRPGAPLVTAALATALATPVPAELPRRSAPLPAVPAAFTGPYVPVPPGEGDGAARGEVALERNPDFAPLEGDWRTALAERIVLAPAGDPVAAARLVLDGRGLVLGDGIAAPDVARRAARRPTEQTVTVPLPVTRFVALRRDRAPLDDLDVRKALSAALDRRAIAGAAAGAGEVAGHWLPPRVPGHDESGGAEGPRNAWLAAPEGDLAVARGYLRRAGHRDGRLGGRPLVALVPDRAEDRAVAEVVRRSLAPLGVRVAVRTGSPAAVAAACRGSAMRADLCPTAALESLVRDPEAVVRAGLDAWGPLRSDWAAGAVAAASRRPEGEGRAWRWAEANRALLQEVLGIPWRWDERALLVSRDVRGVADVRRGTWDLAATALEQER